MPSDFGSFELESVGLLHTCGVGWHSGSSAGHLVLHSAVPCAPEGLGQAGAVCPLQGWDPCLGQSISPEPLQFWPLQVLQLLPWGVGDTGCGVPALSYLEPLFLVIKHPRIEEAYQSTLK